MFYNDYVNSDAEIYGELDLQAPEFVMLDIETLGMGDIYPVITNIGAVKYIGHALMLKESSKINPVLEPVFDSFYKCVVWEGDVTLDTVEWWFKQPEQARCELVGPDREYLSPVLLELKTFVGDLPVWGNGADFDNAIVLKWAKKLGLLSPWKYYNNRCFRTIKNIAGRPDLYVKPKIAHHALYDAEAQAKTLLNISFALNLKLN